MILLVEDDVAIGRSVSQGLGVKGFAVRWLRRSAPALDAIATGEIAVAIIDVGLPDADGFDLCRHIRAGGHKLPILMLTARSSLDDRLEGFDAGADDYLAKPFAFSELVARVGVLDRRAAQLHHLPIVLGDLVIDPAARAAHWQGSQLSLEPRSLALLKELARARGAIVARRKLVDAVWGTDASITDNAVDVAMAALRRRLAQAAPPLAIRTVRGIGFALQAAGIEL